MGKCNPMMTKFFNCVVKRITNAYAMFVMLLLFVLNIK